MNSVFLWLVEYTVNCRGPANLDEPGISIPKKVWFVDYTWIKPWSYKESEVKEWEKRSKKSSVFSRLREISTVTVAAGLPTHPWRIARVAVVNCRTTNVPRQWSGAMFSFTAADKITRGVGNMKEAQQFYMNKELNLMKLMMFKRICKNAKWKKYRLLLKKSSASKHHPAFLRSYAV